MQHYRNAQGDSGVAAYETGPDSIRVKFKHGGTYDYDFATTGPLHVERMKVLADAGAGLATYISKFVKATYARRQTEAAGLTPVAPTDPRHRPRTGGLSQ